MKRLRKERGLSQARVAKELGCQVPKVSLMENGQRPVQDDDLKTLLELFEVPDGERQAYVEELDNAQQPGWWEGYDEQTVPTWYGDFIGLEQGAVRIRTYQTGVIHGLLQTGEYAAALYSDAISGHSEEKVARLVEIREQRQRVLQGEGDLRRLVVVLDEAALRRVAGSREIMRSQLDHVVKLCESNDRVTVRVVPFEQDGASAAAYGSFTVFGFGFSTDPGVVYKEFGSGSVFLGSLRDVDNHSSRFNRLFNLALSPADTLQMLSAAAEDHARSAR